MLNVSHRALFLPISYTHTQGAHPKYISCLYNASLFPLVLNSFPQKYFLLFNNYYYLCIGRVAQWIEQRRNEAFGPGFESRHGIFFHTIYLLRGLRCFLSFL